MVPVTPQLLTIGVLRHLTTGRAHAVVRALRRHRGMVPRVLTSVCGEQLPTPRLAARQVAVLIFSQSRVGPER